MRTVWIACIGAALLFGCGDKGSDGGDGDGTNTSTGGDGDGDGDGDGEPKFDVGSKDDVGGDGDGDICKVNDEMDGVGNCEMEAPPDSFEPDVQWSWNGADGETNAIEVPLVVNLTDDNDDGEVDLCDVPDVVVGVYQSYSNGGSLWVLDGETGQPHYETAEVVNALGNAAVGDIDGDGVAEIVATQNDGNVSTNKVIVFENDGTLKWKSDVSFGASWQHAVSLYDIDADGDVEIIYGDRVFDHLGDQVVQLGAQPGAIQISTAADLDDDGDLEIIMGATAFHHDGAVYYQTGLPNSSHPQVADLDDDGKPEIFISSTAGLSLLEHDGTPVYLNQKPNGGTSWWRPAAIHDIDSNGDPEILVSANNNYSAYEPDLTTIWTAVVSDNSGYAAGTAFDFLGSGAAQAMYADEQFLFIYDEAGQTLLNTPRTSWTEAENPVVADIDNDGSAEILVVSNGGGAPALQAIRDKEDRWIQARRVWNQHAYHVTNVREDGTIPQDMQKSWELLNTFRTQAQIEGGKVCDPPE